MRPNNIQLFAALDVTANQSSGAVPTENVLQCSVVAVLTGTSPTGTLKLQASNDAIFLPNAPVNWVDIPSASASVTGTGTWIVPKTEVCYQYVRLVWVKSSGTGTITANIKTIGF